MRDSKLSNCHERPEKCHIIVPLKLIKSLCMRNIIPHPIHPIWWFVSVLFSHSVWFDSICLWFVFPTLLHILLNIRKFSTLCSTRWGAKRRAHESNSKEWIILLMSMNTNFRSRHFRIDLWRTATHATPRKILFDLPQSHLYHIWWYGMFALPSSRLPTSSLRRIVHINNEISFIFWLLLGFHTNLQIREIVCRSFYISSSSSGVFIFR